MPGDPGDAPTGVGEVDHLQSVAGAGQDARLVRPPVQFLAGGVVQVNAVHGAGYLQNLVLETYSNVLLSSVVPSAGFPRGSQSCHGCSSMRLSA